MEIEPAHLASVLFGDFFNLHSGYLYRNVLHLNRSLRNENSLHFSPKYTLFLSWKVTIYGTVYNALFTSNFEHVPRVIGTKSGIFASDKYICLSNCLLNPSWKCLIYLTYMHCFLCKTNGLNKQIYVFWVQRKELTLWPIHWITLTHKTVNALPFVIVGLLLLWLFR